MENHLYQPIKITLTVITTMVTSHPPLLALDVNLSGNANLNLNPANNNKYSTPMKNFSPGNIPLDRVEMTPLGSEPPTAEVKMLYGDKKVLTKSDVVVVDRDFKNTKEVKDFLRKTGQLVSKSPEIPDDDAQISDTDIQDFLGGYYKYLRSEGLSSASLPVVPTSVVPTTDPMPKTKPLINSKPTSFNDSEQQGLKAKEQKLLISKTSSATTGEVPKSP